MSSPTRYRICPYIAEYEPYQRYIVQRKKWSPFWSTVADFSSYDITFAKTFNSFGEARDWIDERIARDRDDRAHLAQGCLEYPALSVPGSVG